MTDLNSGSSLWKQSGPFDHSVSLGVALTNAINAIFSKYDTAKEHEAMSVSDRGSVSSEEEEDMSVVSEGSATSRTRNQGHQDHEYDTVSMCSEESRIPWSKNQPSRWVRLVDSDSEETMSIANSDSEEDDYGNDRSYHRGKYDLSSWRQMKWSTDAERDRNDSRGRARKPKQRCLRCEAYDAHCKSAADNYRRTLTSYTKTVSELMLGFKRVLERYPELKSDPSDDRVHYMVQAA